VLGPATFHKEKEKQVQNVKCFQKPKDFLIRIKPASWWGSGGRVTTSQAF